VNAGEVARLVTLFERQDSPAELDRASVAEGLRTRPVAPVVGLTGAPGVGKSTLIGALAPLLTVERRVAVVAVDPSSRASGGALLGDRTRIRGGSERLYVRSQASAGQSGGLAPRTAEVVWLLRRLFDLVLVETVGVGQTEDAIAEVADHVLLLLQPLAGDAVQHMKAGVMEAADAVVLTKCDEEALAQRALAELVATIGLARPGEAIPVHAVSARTGRGLQELAAAVLAVSA
jgi:LAO/AO transport system kinase